MNTATRAATDLNAATDLELRLPQKGGGKEGVMSDVGSLGGGRYWAVETVEAEAEAVHETTDVAKHEGVAA